MGGNAPPLIWMCPLFVSLFLPPFSSPLPFPTPCQQAPRLRTWGRSPPSLCPDRRKRLVPLLSLTSWAGGGGVFRRFLFFLFALFSPLRQLTLLSNSLRGALYPALLVSYRPAPGSLSYSVNPRPGSFALLFTEAGNCSTAADFGALMPRPSQRGTKMGLAGGHLPQWLNIHLRDAHWCLL